MSERLWLKYQINRANEEVKSWSIERQMLIPNKNINLDDEIYALFSYAESGEDLIEQLIHYTTLEKAIKYRDNWYDKDVFILANIDMR